VAQVADIKWMVQLGSFVRHLYVDLVTYHTDMRDLMRFMEVKNRYFTKDYPAWTAIGVSALAMPGLLVEIKATAVL
jgi:enamine deaminase RidA (YjgF/YER057c/UK114 family)